MFAGGRVRGEGGDEDEGVFGSWRVALLVVGWLLA